MTKEECEKALEIIDDYVNDYDVTPTPSKKEVGEAMKTLSILVSDYFKIVDYLKSL